MNNTQTAESAPLGVQLWPTLSPEYADNFILDMVETVRTVNGTHVRWTYRNGTTRNFRLGEGVVVDAAALQPLSA